MGDTDLFPAGKARSLHIPTRPRGTSDWAARLTCKGAYPVDFRWFRCASKHWEEALFRQEELVRHSSQKSMGALNFNHLGEAWMGLGIFVREARLAILMFGEGPPQVTRRRALGDFAGSKAGAGPTKTLCGRRRTCIKSDIEFPLKKSSRPKVRQNKKVTE